MNFRNPSSDNSIKLRKNHPVRDIIIIVLCALIVLSGIGLGIDYFRKHSENQGNDDVVTKRYITPVNIHIDGCVKSVNFEPNQVVKSGDTLLILENSDQILIARRIEVLDAYKKNLSCTVIVAPCDGFVDRCIIKEGQLVQAGQLLTNIVSDY